MFVGKHYTRGYCTAVVIGRERGGLLVVFVETTWIYLKDYCMPRKRFTMP